MREGRSYLPSSGRDEHLSGRGAHRFAGRSQYDPGSFSALSTRHDCCSPTRIAATSATAVGGVGLHHRVALADTAARCVVFTSPPGRDRTAIRHQSLLRAPAGRWTPVSEVLRAEAAHLRSAADPVPVQSSSDRRPGTDPHAFGQAAGGGGWLSSPCRRSAGGTVAANGCDCRPIDLGRRPARSGAWPDDQGRAGRSEPARMRKLPARARTAGAGAVAAGPVWRPVSSGGGLTSCAGPRPRSAPGSRR